MAKKYQQQTYTGSYSPAAQSLGFNPIKQVDESKQFKQRTEERNRDLKTYSSYLQKQGAVANSQLNANRAQSSANFAAIKGVLSLTKQGAGMVQDIMKQNELAEQERAEEFEANQALDAMADMGAGDEQAAAQAVEQGQDLRVGIAAEGQAINEAANDGELTPGQQAGFRQSATQVAYTGVQGNVYSARDGHAAYIQARMEELPEAQRPRTEAEAMTLIRGWNGQYLREAGVLSDPMTKTLALEKMPGTVMQNTANLARSTVNAATKADQTANAQQLNNTIYQGVKAGESAEQIWRTASDGAAFGNVGFDGRSAASNAEAIKQTLAAYVANEDVMGLVALRDVPKIPGNPGAGTLGDAYGAEIDKAIEQARDGKVQEYNRGQREREQTARMMIESYYADPTNVDRAQLVANLQQLGPKGRAEAARILKAGLNNDPQLELDIATRAAEGRPYSEYELQSFLDQGLIRDEVYKQHMGESKEAKIDKEVAASVRGRGAQIRAGMTARAGKAVITDVQKLEINTRSGIFAKDLEQRLQTEAKAAGIIDNPMELEKLTARLMNEMLQEPMYSLIEDPAQLGKASWGAPIDQETEYQQRITVAPGQQDVRGLTPEVLQAQKIIRRSELSHIDDYILTQEDTLAAAAITDGNYGDRISKVSKYLGVSPKALVEGQLQRYNQPSLLTFKEKGVPTTEGDFTKSTGYNYITSELGFPARGAAYLTSAIDHESAWNGQREWGQVAGDGTNRNGGLISWASWSNDSARLGAIERHFGRSISQITEREQLDYMKREMQRSYGDAYRVFMDPNASSADLQWAVSRYWGFDPKYTGSRWTDAERYIKSPPIQYTR